MVDTVLAAMEPERMVGWLFVALGFGTLIWTALDTMAGETRVEKTFSFSERVSRDTEPERYGRLIRITIAGSITSLVVGFYLLIVT